MAVLLSASVSGSESLVQELPPRRNHQTGHASCNNVHVSPGIPLVSNWNREVVSALGAWASVGITARMRRLSNQLRDFALKLGGSTVNTLCHVSFYWREWNISESLVVNQ
jgi:hypothetical protein